MSSKRNPVQFIFLGLLFSTSTFAASKRIECPKATYSFSSSIETDNFLRQQKINLLNPRDVNPSDLDSFLGSFMRFPEKLHRDIMDGGGSVLLIHGEGVSEDPNWDKEQVNTIDGKRLWSQTRGGGGSPSHKIPTRIVVNHLYDGHGAIDLFLHEHAHTLDAIYGTETISKSPAYLNAITTEPKLKEYLSAICPDEYCNKFPKEAFADLFTNYHACQASRDQMEREIPLVAEYFKTLTDATVFKKKSIFENVKPRRVEPTPEEIAERQEANRRRREQVEEAAETVLREARSTFNGLRGRIFGKKEPKPDQE